MRIVIVPAAVARATIARAWLGADPSAPAPPGAASLGTAPLGVDSLGTTQAATQPDAQHDARHDAPLGSVMLRPHQLRAVTRLRRAIRDFGGALLADAVGLGKTYVALALARDAARPLVVAPAALRPTWDRASTATGVRFDFVSVESLSRGTWCEGARSHDLVILDEAHHVRNPATRRHRALATLTTRAPVLLLSATPIHNRRRDLVSLLRLFLGAHATTVDAHTLARLVVRRTARDVTPAEAASLSTAPRRELSIPTVGRTRWLRLPDAPELLAALRAVPPPLPPRDGGAAAALWTLGLVHLWSSSDGALRAALRRRLTRAAALAAALDQGRHLSRRALNRWAIDESVVQLELPLPEEDPADLDARTLHATLRAHESGLRAALDALPPDDPRDHARAALLRAVRRRHPSTPILAFTTFADTARALFRLLAPDGAVGLLTGTGGRVAGGVLSRQEVVARFAPRASGVPPPRAADRIDLLLATDCLSEGLDLHDAAVVVHLDLPWTPARLAQRVGRAARLGSPHPTVTVYALSPPGGATAWLRLAARLRTKSAAARHALGPGTLHPGLAPLPPSRSHHRSPSSSSTHTDREPTDANASAVRLGICPRSASDAPADAECVDPPARSTVGDAAQLSSPPVDESPAHAQEIHTSRGVELCANPRRSDETFEAACRSGEPSSAARRSGGASGRLSSSAAAPDTAAPSAAARSTGSPSSAALNGASPSGASPSAVSPGVASQSNASLGAVSVNAVLANAVSLRAGSLNDAALHAPALNAPALDDPALDDPALDDASPRVAPSLPSFLRDAVPRDTPPRSTDRCSTPEIGAPELGSARARSACTCRALSCDALVCDAITREAFVCDALAREALAGEEADCGAFDGGGHARCAGMWGLLPGSTRCEGVLAAGVGCGEASASSPTEPAANAGSANAGDARHRHASTRVALPADALPRDVPRGHAPPGAAPAEDPRPASGPASEGFAPRAAPSAAPARAPACLPPPPCTAGKGATPASTPSCTAERLPCDPLRPVEPSERARPTTPVSTPSHRTEHPEHSRSTRSPASARWLRIARTLERWTTHAPPPPIETAPAAITVATAPAPIATYLALCEHAAHPLLLTGLHGHATASASAVARALRFADPPSPPTLAERLPALPPPRLTRIVRELHRYAATRQATHLAGRRESFPLHRALIARANALVAASPPHLRHRAASATAELRATSHPPWPAGLERAVAALAHLPNHDWLPAVAALFQTRRTPTRPAPAFRIVTILALHPYDPPDSSPRPPCPPFKPFDGPGGLIPRAPTNNDS